MIKVSKFSGENKKISPHLLPDEIGQTVANAYVRGGKVKSLKMPKDVLDLVITSTKSIWQYIDGSNKYWCASTADIDTVRSPVANDSFHRLYFTGGSYPAAYANDIKSTPFDSTTDFYKLGTKAPTAAPTFVSGNTGGALYRAYVYTYVSRYGEEGPPSPVLSTSTYLSGNVVIGGFTDPSDGHLKTATGSNANKPKIRLYRTNSSGQGVATFQFVKEVDTNGITWATFQITDDVASGNLGEVIPSITWEPPPAALTGLTGMTIGCLAGFTTNSLYFSELFLPHAWNPEYEISFSERIVGLGVIGSSLLVLTDEVPYLVNGSHPSNMQKMALSAFFPCSSKRGIVSTDGGVLYPSKEGLILATRNGCNNLTRDMLSMEDMDLIDPSSWTAVFYNGQYLAFWKNTGASTEGGIIIDINDSHMVSLNVYRSALYTSADDSKLYVAGRLVPSDPVESIQQWEGDPYNFLQFTWKSKMYMLDRAVNFSTARVIVEPGSYERIVGLIEQNEYFIDLNQSIFSSPLDGEINGAAINEYPVNGDTLYELFDLSLTPYTNFKLYCDGVLRYSKNVDTNTVFRLPSGFRGKIWEFQIDGFIPVQQVVIGGSVREVMSNG